MMDISIRMTDKRTRFASLAVLTCLLMASSTTHAFNIQRPTAPSSLSRLLRSMVLRDPPTSARTDASTDDENNRDPRGRSVRNDTLGSADNVLLSAEEADAHDFLIWKVNASDALGSMLLQMQSSFQQQTLSSPEEEQVEVEEEMLQDDHPRSSEFLLKDEDEEERNNADISPQLSTTLDSATKDSSTKPKKKISLPPLLDEEDDADDDKSARGEAGASKEDAAKTTRVLPAEPQPPLTSLNAETAKELDDAVNVLEESYPFFTAPVEVVEVPSIYGDRDQDTATADTVVEAEDRELLSRDLRQLAVSIASRTESVDQWATVVAPQIGGIHPLLETIRVGARSMAEENEEVEAILEDASRACRALRDLCALSPELAAVLVDSVLRANESYDKGGLMRDLCRLLQYAGRYDELTAAQNTERAPPRQWFVRGLRRKLQRQQPTPPSSVQKAEAPPKGGVAAREVTAPPPATSRKSRRIARRRCQLYVVQLLLAMSVTSDEAVHAIRDCPGMKDAVLQCSSYAQKERRRRWMRYPVELSKWLWKESSRARLRRRKRKHQIKEQEAESKASSPELKQQKNHHRQRRPFLEAASLTNDLNGEICKTANQVLAAIGCNQWIPKTPGQRGLRILTLDGGGSRGMSSVTAVAKLVETVGVEVCDSFDMICGTSTGGIIAFLTGLRQESGAKAVARYNELIKQIFVKSPLSTPLMLFTTASYDESHFNNILQGILEDDIMLDSRADATTPLVFAVTSKMSSTPTHVALFKNYNYASGELADPFVVDPDQARADLGLPLELEHPDIRNGEYRRKEAEALGGSTPGQRLTAEGSRHPGSFRVLQRYALRASTAAPTFFKPVCMGGEMYCDGGIVSSNPTAIAVHEARTLFPDVPIELVVSIGTGRFYEQKSAPKIGWDGIIGQIVNSACDGEQIHYILEDILGDSATLGRKSHLGGTKYYRFNPIIGWPDEYPIDVVDPEKLEKLKQITVDYMNQPEQQERLQEIAEIVTGQPRWSSRR